MKSAYELAMERLEKQAPSSALTDEQRAKLADIENRYQSKIAEKEVFLGGLIAKAEISGNSAEAMELKEQLHRETRRLREDCEAEKEKIRSVGV
ncbi:MAG: hypothetical protein ACFCU3_02330 [Verrucomicrobiales bacterium]